MSDSVESRGKTVDEAVAEALLQLGARRDEVDVEVLEEAKGGMLGLFGARSARVRVTRKSSGGAERPPQQRRADRVAAEAAPAAEEPQPPRASQPAPGQPSADEAAPAADRVAAAAAGAAQHEGAAGGEVQAESIVTPLRCPTPEEVPAALEKLTSDLLRRSGFPSRCEVREGEYWQVKVVTDETSAGMLIGRHGATIDAVEHLVERMASQAAGQHVNMNLDINNYRRRREEKLVQRAQLAADRVKREGQEIHFEPMSARERRIIHLEVAKAPGLQTFTLADGAGKHVVVAPAGQQPPAGPGDEGAAGDEFKRSRGESDPSDGGRADV